MRLFRSASSRVLSGSAAVAVATVCFGGACAAQPGGDALTQPAAYHGPYLTWAGKTSAPDAAPQVAAAVDRRRGAPGAGAGHAANSDREATAATGGAASGAAVFPAQVR